MLAVLLRIVCVLAMAIGAGLLTAGAQLKIPEVESANPSVAAEYYGGRKDDLRVIPAALYGVGVGLMVLGGVGIVVPWIDALIRPRPASP